MKKEKKLLDESQLKQAAGGVQMIGREKSEAEKRMDKKEKHFEKAGWGDIF